MSKPRIYDSPNRIFRLKSAKGLSYEVADYLFDVYNVKTNLRVGVADLESATFRPIGTDSTLTVMQLRDIANTLEALEPDYQD